MNKSQLINGIHLKTGISSRQAAEVIDALTEITAETLFKGEPVAITGFGVFEAKSRSSRIGRNPHTGEAIEIPAKVLPSFKPAQALKDKVSGKKSHRKPPAK